MSSLVAGPQRHRCPELLWGRLDGQVAAVTGLVPHQHPDEQVWMVRGQAWEGGGGGGGTASRWHYLNSLTEVIIPTKTPMLNIGKCIL